MIGVFTKINRQLTNNLQTDIHNNTVLHRLIKPYDTLRALVIFWRKRFRQAHLNQVAGSLAFATTLALVPMLSIATLLIGYLPGLIRWREALQKWLATSLMPGPISNSVSSYITQFSSKAKGLTLFGSIGLVLTTFFMLITIEKAFNQVWGVKIPRSFMKRLLIFVSATFIGPFLLGLSIYLTSLLVSASQGWIRHLPLAFELLASTVPVLLTALTFLLVYKMGPSAFVEWRDALIGGMFAAVVFEFAKLGFAYFVTKMPVYKTLYGAFAIVPLFLLWIYLTWWVTMAGAVLTATLPDLRQRRALQGR